MKCGSARKTTNNPKGPSNVEAPPPTQPSEMATLRGHYKADVGVYTDTGGTTAATDGDTVLRWNDQSDNGNDLIYTAGARVLDTGPDVSTLPSSNMDFNNGVPSSDDYYNFSADEIITIGMVMGVGGRGVGSNYISRGTRTGGWRSWVETGPTWGFMLIDDWNTAKMIRVRGSTTMAATNSTDYVIIQYDGTRAASGITMWVNGVQQTITTITDDLSTGDIDTEPEGFIISMDYSLGGPASGRPGEVWIAQQLLTQDIVDDFQTKAESDWGL